MNEFIEQETGVEANNRVRELEQALEELEGHADKYWNTRKLCMRLMNTMLNTLLLLSMLR